MDLCFNKIPPMKALTKYLYLLALTGISTGTILAQNWELAVPFAYNYTSLYNSHIANWRTNNFELGKKFSGGISAGMEIRYRFTDRWSLSGGVLYAFQQQRYNYNDLHTFNTKSDGIIYNNLKYLDMPLLVKLNIRKLYFETGPQLGILLKAEEGFDGINMKDVKQNFKKTSWSWNLGIGADFKINDRLGFFTAVRCGLGISDITVEYGSIDKIPGNSSIVTYGAHSMISSSSSSNFWDLVTGNYTSTPRTYSYEKTRRNFGGIRVGVVYSL